MKKKNASVLSLFTGAGGLDIGFHSNGFKIKACVEIDSDSCHTLKKNKGKYVDETTKIYCEDITLLDPRDVKREIGEIDFMIGGPPCQSFSAAGRRAGGVYGINDTRGSLFWYYAQFVKEFKPQGFLFENVKGILQANSRKDWTIIQDSFRELGYNLSVRILDAADYGTPQHRERVIMVGWKDKTEFKFPQPLYGPNSSSGQKYITPRNAFSDIDNPNEVVEQYSGKYGHLLKDIPPGLNYSFYTEKLGHPEPLFAWRSKFSGFLYKLDPNTPSKTLVAHQGKYDGPFHWKNRKLNISELIRIQGFPKDYHFHGSIVSIQKQIGNSVAPKLSDILAKSVQKQIFKQEIDIKLMSSDVVLKKHHKSIVKEILARPNAILEETEIKDWPTQKIKLDLHSEFITNTCSLKNGTWTIKLIDKFNKIAEWIKFDLEFHNPVSNTFERIRCHYQTETISNFQYAWDFIHKIIDHSCSYESLHPLYGHFTEPYPKFKLKIVTSDNESSLSIIIDHMCDFKYLATTHSIESLENELNDKVSIPDFINFLRAKGVDVRTHETNRTIKKGEFRLCYPFCMPSWQQNFTNWTEIGNHKTGDLLIKDLIDK